MYDYVVEVTVDDVSTFGNTDVVPAIIELFNQDEVAEIILEGPQGPPGPVLLLEHGAAVPDETPDGTIIFEKDS